LEFEWDATKAAANVRRTQSLVRGCGDGLRDPLGWIVADPRHSLQEGRFVLLGLSQSRLVLAVMYTDRGEAIRIISPAGPHAASRGTMKKTRTKRGTGRIDIDEILPEYDFSQASRNKYASRYAAGSAVVVLEPDGAAAFPSSGEANEALRALAGIIQKHRSRRSR